jgi:hypothetical protein
MSPLGVGPARRDNPITEIDPVVPEPDFGDLSLKPFSGHDSLLISCAQRPASMTRSRIIITEFTNTAKRAIGDQVFVVYMVILA